MRGGNGGSGDGGGEGGVGRAGEGGGGGGQPTLQTTQPNISSHGLSHPQPHLYPLNNSFNFDDPQSCEEREWQQQVDFIL